MNFEKQPLSLRLKRRQSLDFSLLGIILGLCLFGLLTVLSASAAVAEWQSHNSLYFFIRQGVYALLGLFALGIGLRTPLHVVRRQSKPFLLFSAFLLLAIHLPGLGVTELGATRWLHLGPISIQPSELAKIALIIYLSDVLARFGPKNWTFQQLRQAFLPLLAILGMVLFEPDLGTTIILASTAYALFWANGTRLFQLLVMAAGGIVAVLSISLSTPYQRNRWLGFLNPWADPQGNGFQQVQSLLAIGSGGFFGVGWGQGKQKLFYLPIQYADFIFAVFAEEWGLLGGLVLLGGFFSLFVKGMSIANQAEDPFYALLAVGLSVSVTVQASINLGVVTSCLPTTGIPLPFFSYGGTSLILTLFSMGLLLNISRQAVKKLA
jgi:cell division protein FtsW